MCYTLKRLCSISVLVSLAFALSTGTSEARAKLIVVFPLRSTQALASTAERLRRRIITQLAGLDGYDARAIDAPATGRLADAAAGAGAAVYVTGQVLAADAGYRVTLGSFEVATDASVGRYDAVTSAPDVLPDEPRLNTLLAAMQTAQTISQLLNVCPQDASDTSGLTMEVLSSWQSGVQGHFIIHDRILIHGTDVPKTVTACDFKLTVSLLNGQSMGIAGSPNASSNVEHILGMTNGMVAGMAAAAIPFIGGFAGLFHQKVRPDVDPSEDLGGLGSVTVPAGGTSKVVVTFDVEQYLADPNAPNTAVAFKMVSR